MVVAGYVGSGTRMEYTAIGDVIGLASRVEEHTRVYRCSLLLCDETARLVSADLLLRKVDRVLIKGRGRPTHVYDLVGRPETATPEAARLLSSYRSAFALYAAGRFEEAVREFDTLCRALLYDGPARALMDRYRVYMPRPPSDWDCVFRPDKL